MLTEETGRGQMEIVDNPSLHRMSSYFCVRQVCHEKTNPVILLLFVIMAGII